MFFLNFIELNPGEALFTPPGIPHAYISGNVIECMANSDNVVRVGLTSKFKDAGTLLQIVDATPGKPQYLKANPAMRGRSLLKLGQSRSLRRS